MIARLVIVVRADNAQPLLPLCLDPFVEDRPGANAEVFLLIHAEVEYSRPGFGHARPFEDRRKWKPSPCQRAAYHAVVARFENSDIKKAHEGAMST